jgi:GST-like protein
VVGGRVSLAEAPSVQRWHDAIDARLAVVRGLAILADRRRPGPISDRARDILYGATQHTAR